MKLTYYGHACFAVSAGGRLCSSTPFISQNPLAGKIDLEKIDADFILVSMATAITSRTSPLSRNALRATVIAPFEVGEWFEKKESGTSRP